MSDPATQLLFANIHALPDDEFGTLNYVPFSVEGDEVDRLKFHMSQAIVNLFRNAGYPMELGKREEFTNRQIVVACRSCSEPLLTAVVDDSGHVAVPAAAVIDGMASRSRECPHHVVTLEDQRVAIQEALEAKGE